VQVAIKRISRVFQDLIDAKRILREIKLLRHLGRHDNIIEICDIMTGPPDTEDFHTLYIVMQVCCLRCWTALAALVPQLTTVAPGRVCVAHARSLLLRCQLRLLTRSIPFSPPPVVATCSCMSATSSASSTRRRS
jgi:ferredoxin-fold anticodon binding domain-containing protein